LLALGLCGIFSRGDLFRPLVWIASVALFVIGMGLWHAGGIAEPFQPKLIFVCCAAAFWPVVGCLIGEGIRYCRRLKTRRKSRNHGI
jgi:hypothetical protein